MLLKGLLWSAALASLAACGGGTTGGTGGKDASSDLVLIDVSVSGQAGVPLNEIIRFEFSEDLDPGSVRADTIRIRRGPNFGFQVPGDFRVDGNRVESFPRLPVLPDLSDSGLQPGTSYRILLPGVPKVATVRSFAGDRLRRKQQETFETAALSGPLFADNYNGSKHRDAPAQHAAGGGAITVQGAGDVVATLFDDTMTIEVQMAVEDVTELGSPDLSAEDVTDLDGDGERDDTLDPGRVSEWTPLADIESQNGKGFQFLPIRVAFQLDANQSPADPLPSLDRLRVPFRF